MDRHTTKSVFISSTYSDLKNLRKKVADRVYGLSYSVIQMEHFPATAESALENSLRQLEKGCDYFILILGHKYGTIPDGKEISITHSEYRKALEMKRKKYIEDIFIFIGSDEVLISPKDVESDLLRSKARSLKSEIINNGNTYRSFSNEEELFQAIYETFFQAAHPNAEIDTLDVVFTDFEQIKYTIEHSLESKSVRVNKALGKITKGFSPVFDLESDSQPNLKHPILSYIKESLEDSISHVAFDSNSEGKIERWGIRHVIFRVETAIKLMSAIKDNNLLFSIGEEIGSTASKDLFDRVINNQKNKNLIPVSIRAFIELFDYWDSSGGWGKLRYIEEINANEKMGKWTIVTRNNFLINELGTQSESEINHLYNFWKGYIKGALNVALTRLSQIYSTLSPDLKRKVIFPPYRKIISVERELDENDPHVDLFSVTFEKHPYGWAFEILSSAKMKADNMADDLNDKIVILTELSAILSTLKSENEEYFSSIMAKLDEQEQMTVNYIIQHKYLKIDFSNYQCLGMVNSILQAFVNS